MANNIDVQEVVSAYYGLNENERKQYMDQQDKINE